jgi:hypothetical protein
MNSGITFTSTEICYKPSPSHNLGNFLMANGDQYKQELNLDQQPHFYGIPKIKIKHQAKLRVVFK